MAKIKTVEEADYNRVSGSLRTFLEGTQPLKWLLASIRSSGVHGTRLVEIFVNLRGNGNQQRFEEAVLACRQEGLLP